MIRDDPVRTGDSTTSPAASDESAAIGQRLVGPRGVQEPPTLPSSNTSTAGRAGTTTSSQATPAAMALTTWERRFTALDTWLPHVLLGAATVLGLFQAGLGTSDRARMLGLAALAALWVTGLHTVVPAEQRGRGRRAGVYFVGLLTLATLLMLEHVVFFVFAITGLLHAAHLRPRPMVFAGVGATALSINLITWGGFPRQAEEAGGFVVLLLLQTGLIGYGITGSERLMELTEERRRTVAELEATLAENEGLYAQLLAQAREAGVHDERQRMAREIHDTIAQGLTGVITQLEAADQSRHDEAAMRRHLGIASELARHSLAEARRSVQALEPGELERGRLPGALDRLARDWTERTGVTVELSTIDAPASLPADVEVALLRVAQEALANTSRHAAATRVRVTLSGPGELVTLDLRDDGIGFDPAVSASHDRFGLRTMRQRLTAVDGRLVVESEPGGGTAVQATVPLVGPGEGR